MDRFRAVFTIVQEKNCPLYQSGDRMVLSERTFAGPADKETCLILARDMMSYLVQLLGERPLNYSQYQERLFPCSGCVGLIKMQLLDPELSDSTEMSLSVASGEKQKRPSLFLENEAIAQSAFVKSLPPEKVEPFFSGCRQVNLKRGDVLIHKEQKAPLLYLLVEGRAQVEDSGMVLAILTPGELCGEMSYLGVEQALSTVRALGDGKALAIEGFMFNALLGKEPAVQLYMARLLAQRLQRTNTARTREFMATMSGRIDEILPAELFQIFHMHQKTGVLNLQFPKGRATVSFRQGSFVSAAFGKERGTDAVFAVLAEKKGRYQFNTGLAPEELKLPELGDFMGILMEGVRRVDEDSEDVTGAPDEAAEE